MNERKSDAETKVDCDFYYDKQNINTWLNFSPSLNLHSVKVFRLYSLYMVFDPQIINLFNHQL